MNGPLISRVVHGRARVGARVPLNGAAPGVVDEYDGRGMIDTLRHYLGTTLPWDLGKAQYLRLFGTVFALVFASALLFHLLLRDTAEPIGLLVHAAIIGAVYTVVVGLACTALYASRKAIDRVAVWHIWLTSFAAFAVGYFFPPFDGLAPWGIDSAGNHLSGDIGFFQLLPVWALVTYFFLQPYVTRGLHSELDRLRELNALLEAGRPARNDGAQPVRFQSGRTDFVIDAADVRNITVEDHYCYVHYRHKDGYAKRDLGMPLRDIVGLLPPGFVQVHRSHVVNLSHVRSVRRKDRNVRLLLGADVEVPVSRHRLHRVLPPLRQRLATER